MLETGNQLKGYIQRESKAHGINSNYAYNYYFTRAFLEKLYTQEKLKMVLKGSYSQFASLGKLERPLTDIDIITYGTVEEAKNYIDNVFQNSKKIKFKILNQFVTTNATLNYKILCDFDGKNSRISIDLKKEIATDFSEVQMPTLFSKDKKFNTTSISIEEHLASKLYVALLHLKLHTSLGRDFRRFKDFFDIYTILGSTNIDEYKVMSILQFKIQEDEFLRDYELEGKLFNKNFIDDNQSKWDNDKKEYQFLTDTTFKESVEVTNELLNKKR